METSDITLILNKKQDIYLLNDVCKDSTAFISVKKVTIVFGNQFSELQVIKFPKNRSQQLIIELYLEQNASASIVLVFDQNFKQITCMVTGQEKSFLTLYSLINPKNNIDVTYVFNQQGPESVAYHAGVYHIHHNVHLNIQHEQIHAKERTQSISTMHGVTYDNAVVNFEGMIRIEDQAYFANAGLSHKTLICSDQAQVRSIPNLEIKTNEVSCRHATAVDHVDEDQLFYLMARGYSYNQAHDTIAQGFCLQIFDPLNSELKRVLLDFFTM